MYRVPVIAGCVLMGSLPLFYVRSSWHEHGWGMATLLASIVATGAVAAGASLILWRKQQHNS